MIQNDLLLKALAGEKTKRPPVWLMRQAGRYMASYRALREKYDFLTLCKTPELVLGVTLLPIQQFGFDAAIVFSDILLLIEAMGIPVSFIENSGPVIHRHIETPNDIAHLYTDGIKERMDYLFYPSSTVLPRDCYKAIEKRAFYSSSWLCRCSFYACKLFDRREELVQFKKDEIVDVA